MKVAIKRRANAVGIVPITVMALLCASQPAHAQFTEYTWTGSASNNWNASANWANTLLPLSGPTRRLRFGSSSRKTLNQNLGNPFVLNRLTFDDIGYTISGNVLNFQTSNDIDPQLVQTVAGTNTLACALSLSSLLTVDLQPSDSNLVVSGQVKGDSGLTKIGAGTLTLSNVNNTLSGDLQVNGGTFILNSGASLTNVTGYLGFGTGTVGMMNVSDTGTVWKNTGDLYVGNTGTGTLNITAGGAVNVTGTVYLNNGAKSSLVLNGGTLMTSTLSGNAGSTIAINGTNSTTSTLSIANDSTFAGTLTGTGNLTKTGAGTLTLTGTGNTLGNAVFMKGGGLTLSGGGKLSSSFVGIATNQGENASVTITGQDSQWNNTGDLYVGYQGNGSLNITAGGAVNTDGLTVGNTGTGTLNITAGGTVNNGTSYLGVFTVGTVTVTGTGSQWNNTGDLYVGYRGNGSLNITAGGAVNVAKTTYLGYIVKSSLVLNGGTLTTGTLSGNAGSIITVSGTNNTLSVASNSTFAGTLTGTGNLTKTGAGTLTLTGTGNMLGGAVFMKGGGLSLSGGGKLSSILVDIATNQGENASATVTGTGSQWNNTSDLYVGNQGNGTLSITAGGTVSSLNGRIGFSSGGGGMVNVTGAGSQWNNIGSTYVGNLGTGTLNITSGGTVSNSFSYLGYDSGSNGTVTVTGPGSQWNNKGDLYVGHQGTGTLNITTGGTVNVTGTTYLTNSAKSSLVLDGGTLTTGSLTGNTGSTITVSGTNNTTSTLSIASDSTFAGRITGSGSLNKTGVGTLTLTSIGNTLGGAVLINGGGLTLSGGGKLSSTFVGIATNQGENASATVTGAGSQWSNTGNLYVGLLSTGTLNITAGGTVNSAGCFLGGFTGDSGTVTVTGVGSQWTNTGNLYIGNQGTGTLNITEGGTVNVTGTTYLTYGMNSSLVLNGGTLTTGTLSGNVGSTISINGTNSTTSTLSVASNSTFAGTLTGTGNLAKTGAATLTLTGANTFTGTARVDGGTLVQSGNTWAAGATVNNGATLRLENDVVASLGTNNLRANTGSTIVYDNATIQGGFLSGTGTHTVAAGGLKLFGTTIQGTLVSDHSLTLDSVVVGSSGKLTISNVATASDLEVDGQLSINRGGRLDNTGGTSVVLGGGSRTAIGVKEDITSNVPDKATLDLGGQTLEVNGGLLVNNGIIQNGLVNINYGGTIKGSGSYLGGYALNDGGKILFGNSPGVLQSGSATWNAGATLTFQINDAIGKAGVNWGINQINGTLTLNGGDSTTAPFDMSLESLLAGSGDVAGTLTGFSSSRNYSWEWVRTTQGISGFDSQSFSIDASNFTRYNDLDGGVFSVSQRGGSLWVNFISASSQSVAPEPGTLGFLLLGGVCVVIARRRSLATQ